MKLSPLLMVGLNACFLAMLAFGAALVSQTAPPIWLWTLNVGGLVSGVVSFGYWWRQALAS